MNTSSTHTRLGILVLIGGILLIGAVIYFKMNIFQPVFQNDFAKGLEAHINENTDTAIAQFEDALRRAPDKASQGRTTQYLIDNLFARGQGSDTSRAISLAESVIEDTTMPPQQRALVLNILASNIMSKDESFFTLYFTSKTMKKFLGGENAPRDGNNVAIRMYKTADSIYPTIYAKYRITDPYYRLIKQEQLAEGFTSIEDMARAIQTSVAEGDAIAQSDQNYNAGSLARSYYLRVINLGYSGIVLGNISVEQKEEEYQKTIQKISGLTGGNDPRVTSYLYRTKYHYAVMLATQSTGREDDIIEILKPFGDVDTNDISFTEANNYFRRVYARPDDNTQKGRMQRLVAISPEFRLYLSRLGLPV